MTGRRGNMDPFFGFGDPFAGFGGLGGHQSMVSSFFGGRDHFDDPFFTQPFGGMFDSPFGPTRNMNMHPSGFPMRSALMNGHPSGFPVGGSLMNGFPSGFSTGNPMMSAHPQLGFGSESHLMNAHPFGVSDGQTSQTNISRGPIIEELNSDGEEEVEVNGEKKERNRKQMHFSNELNHVHNSQPQPQTHSFTFQSSTVTYGGSNGTYYTKSRTMRTGSDGLTIDESKEADSTTGQATHRLSRGIHDKGHTAMRNLQTDGRVDTKQILHNLEEGDLTGFEETWKGKARKSLPGWSEGFNLQNGNGSSSHTGQQNRGGWALPSTVRSHHSGHKKPDGRTNTNIGGRKGS